MEVQVNRILVYGITQPHPFSFFLQLICRFNPEIAGEYTYHISATEYKTSSANSNQQTVLVKSVSPMPHGFVTISTEDYSYFAFQDGTVFFPIGENLCWATDTFYYDM